MDDLAALRQQERQAYATLARLRDAVDAMPDGHPAAATVTHAVALAEQYWHQLRAACEAAARPATPAGDGGGPD